MKIRVKAKPGAQQEKVERIDEIHYVVHVKEVAERGKANRAMISTLADYFKVAQSQIKMISGSKARQKVFEVPGTKDLKGE